MFTVRTTEQLIACLEARMRKTRNQAKHVVYERALTLIKGNPGEETKEHAWNLLQSPSYFRNECVLMAAGRHTI